MLSVDLVQNIGLGKNAQEKVEMGQKALNLVDCRNISLAGIYNAT